ncbi:MAG: hypothetical protein CBD97_01915 [Pelagibacteraceae bacterium TMED237]|nr:MAG: hypothetical protein CBD97_01915 [Pelagibacteraceae bacterium TMED237]|tara:strand:- start:9697 stop:10974 length:1278 start_codon:yes stop_codon:yes gene_type:complete
MSLKRELISLEQELRERISKELTIEIESKFSGAPNKFLFPYVIDNKYIRLPFAYGVLIGFNRPIREIFSSTNVQFIGKLREEQKEVRKEALKVLSKTGSVMISAYPGFGKTCGAIDLATSIKFKTLIIVNKIVLIKQWKESILKFCPESCIQIITPKDKFNDNAEFYIINAQNVEKMGRNFFDDIGTLIIDEAHMIMAETLSKCMNFITPRYLIGLTATPYRPDGLNILLELYFGVHKIVRKLYRKHTVYKIETGYKPPVERDIKTKRLNWNLILDSQAKNDYRNDSIVDLIIGWKDRNFLVLVKRVEQGLYIVNSLKEAGEYVTHLIGANQEFDTEARILVGTCQKVGVGFDHSKLDTLLLAADIEEYFVQYLGRIFRTKDNEPIVFDLIDNNPTLRKHFDTRMRVYKEHGGCIKDGKEYWNEV